MPKALIGIVALVVVAAIAWYFFLASPEQRQEAVEGGSDGHGEGGVEAQDAGEGQGVDASSVQGLP